jgi:SH3 domain protein
MRAQSPLPSVLPSVLTTAILAIGLFIGSIAFSPLSQAQEKIRYVRDWISIPLHETADTESTVIHKGVVSGAPLALLQIDEKAGAAKVRTQDGIEGWIPTRYLSSEPGARGQLDKANTEIERLNKLNEQLRIGAPSVAALQDSSTKQLAEAQTVNAKLNGEIDALKRSIGDNSKLVQDHSELSKHAEQLQTEVTRLNTELTEIHAGKQQEFFRDGAFAVGGGALLTLLAARFWPRKRRTDDWV